MSLFNFKKNYFVGVDFGTSAIKMVELKFKSQQAHLVNYGWADLGLSLDSDGRELKLVSFDTQLESCLDRLLKKMELKSDSAYISLPGSSGLITLIEFPDMKESELEKAIRFEAHKYVPTPLSEVSLGWEIVSKKETGILEKKNIPHRIQVLLVAAPNKDVARYENIIQSVKLKVKAIELETFSLARSLVGDDLGTYLIVDIGAKATNIVLVEKGIIKVNRNINVGGSEITNTIAESMNISKQRAESFKKEERDLLNSKESAIIMPTLEFVANEALRIIAAYKERNRAGKVDGAILSGGTAKMEGIDEYFSKTLNVRSAVGDPWKKIVYDKRLSAAVKEIGTSYSVAMGLALRGIDEYRRD